MLASTLVRNPLSDLRRLERDLDWMFDNLLGEREFGETTPEARAVPISLWADREKVRAAVRLPAVRQEDVEVSVVGNQLNIHASLPAAPEREDARWIRRERLTGEVSRSIDLPYRVDADSVDARMENGILLVDLPRPEAERPRRIEITRANG